MSTLTQNDGYQIHGDPGGVVTIYAEPGDHKINLTPWTKDGKIDTLKVWSIKDRPAHVTFDCDAPLVVGLMTATGNVVIGGLDTATATNRVISGKSMENCGRGVS